MEVHTGQKLIKLGVDLGVDCGVEMGLKWEELGLRPELSYG